MLPIVLLCFFVSSCNKTQVDNIAEQAKSSNAEIAMLKTGNAVNPFSITSIQKALADLGRTDPLDEDRIYYYYSFDPSNLTGEMLSIVEADENHHILDYPFADGGAFTDAFMSNYEANSAAEKDGKMYIVFKKASSLSSLFDGNGQLGATKLDELYLPNQNDKELQLRAMANSQNVTVEAFKISWPCLFKQPRGRVTYLDSETNQNRGVPGIQVWAIAFGIPISTYANDDGFYAVPWLFSVGTVIGTHAKNSRVNVKPIDGTGNWADIALQIIGNFIIGSVHVEGTASACQMKNDININFNQNNQKRYWAQILDAVRLHHIFAAQDGISSAPWNLTWYALWDNNRGGAFSAPMLSHISTNPISLITNVLSLVFDTDIAVSMPNVLSLLTGLVPSITTDESPASMNDTHYSERLMQGSLHELAHASFFTQVGQIYWVEAITNILVTTNSSCGNYGCGTEVFAGNTQLNEAWAEYLGKDYHRRIHPNGQCEVIGLGWRNYPAALEIGTSFQQNWIPTGVFFDLQDPANEPNDVVQGVTNAQMFGVFSPNTHDFCDYKTRFRQNFPNVATNNQLIRLFTQNNFTVCN